MNIKQPCRSEETHPLTWRIQNDKKTILFDEYRSKNGYLGAEKALKNMSSNEIIKIIKDSGLKGRGGAGFLTGLKWSLMPKDESMDIRYLICNADEMEPGTYKDRFLMEQIPHLLIEGMIIAAFALRVYRGYIFLRYEYIKVLKCLRFAISEASNKGFLGKNIFGTNFSFDLFIHTGAGRYICGEETALINSLEGRRANPRFKPPFPALVGLWGKPTCVNNVETLANIPAILLNGVEWYKKLSKSDDTGTKMMGFSGRVKNPGVWELPFGVTAREILEDYAGGMQNGLALKAWLPGGAGTKILTEKHLDYPIGFSSFSKLGIRLGTGLSIAIDNKINIISLICNIEEFFARESCGLCTPCRDGLPWCVKILRALKEGKGVDGDIEMLEELSKNLDSGKAFCAHAPGAIEPLRSAIKDFRKEFQSGINYKKSLIDKNLIT